ncbi:flagellar hook-length control protein FliK [Luminiphilus sp.]|nr:flagellar hook-length control protein FliK [Luminiphilus sp.]MDC3316558.1 flagellar hook-length control protein FliK [bacterium]
MTVDNFIANASVLDGLVKNQPKQAGAASNQGLRELENTEGSFDTALKNAVNDSQKDTGELLHTTSCGSDYTDNFEDGWQDLPKYDPEIAALLQLFGQENSNGKARLEDLKGLPPEFLTVLQHFGAAQSTSQTSLQNLGDHVAEGQTLLQYFGSIQSSAQGIIGPAPGLNNRTPPANQLIIGLLPDQLNDAFTGRNILSAELVDIQVPSESAVRELVGSRGDVPILNNLAAVQAPSLRTGTLAGSVEISLLAKEPEVFATGLATYLRVLKTEGGTEARLQLSPIELGRLAITIQTEGEETRVSFVVENSQARSAVESSLPRLRDMLEQSGLSLSDAEVTEKHPNEKDTEHKADSHNEDGLDDDIQSDQPTTAFSADSSLLVDAYA